MSNFDWISVDFESQVGAKLGPNWTKIDQNPCQKLCIKWVWIKCTKSVQKRPTWTCADKWTGSAQEVGEHVNVWSFYLYILMYACMCLHIDMCTSVYSCWATVPCMSSCVGACVSICVSASIWMHVHVCILERTSARFARSGVDVVGLCWDILGHLGVKLMQNWGHMGTKLGLLAIPKDIQILYGIFLILDSILEPSWS